MTNEQITALRVVADLMDQIQTERPCEYFFSGYEDSWSFGEVAIELREMSGIPRPKREPHQSYANNPEIVREITELAMHSLATQLRMIPALSPIGESDMKMPQIGDTISVRKPARYVRKPARFQGVQ